MEKVTFRELSKLIRRLSSTAIGVFPAPLNYRCLIQKSICHNTFEEKVTVLVEARKELLWWKENLALCTGRPLLSPPPQIVINSDTSLQGWKVSCQFPATGGFWSVEEWKFHINVLELKVDKLAIMSFTLKERDAVSVHIRMDNMTVLSYLTKMGLPKTRTWLRSAKKFDNIF